MPDNLICPGSKLWKDMDNVLRGDDDDDDDDDNNKIMKIMLM